MRLGKKSILTVLSLSLYLLMSPTAVSGQEKEAAQDPTQVHDCHCMKSGGHSGGQNPAGGMGMGGGMGMHGGGGMGMRGGGGGKGMRGSGGGMGMHGSGMGMRSGGGGMHGGGMEKMHGMPGEKDFACWKEQIGISAEQLSSLKDIYRTLRKEHLLERAKMESAEVDLQALLDIEKVDLGKVEKVVKEIEGHRTRLKMGHISSWEKAKKVLSEEQRKKMENLPGSFSPMRRQSCEPVHAPHAAGIAPKNPAGEKGAMPEGHKM